MEASIIASDGEDGSSSSIDSLTAFQILEECGISSPNLDLHYKVMKDLCFALNAFSSIDQVYTCVITGSAADGMTNLSVLTGGQTDIDIMETYNKFIAIENLDDLRDDTSVGQFLIENRDIDNPAFVKLLLVEIGTDPENVGFRLIESVFQERQGRYYLSSAEMKILLKNSILKYTILNVFPTTTFLDSIMLEGPAATHNIRNVNFGIDNGYSMGNTDIVFAIPFPSWPSVASEWLQRPRIGKWPDKEVISLVRCQGCFMVPKCSKDGHDRSLEWSFSFAHVEPILIRSMNDVMLKTYALLKLIRTAILKPVIECKIISSYILKTSLFWDAESTAREEWVPEKLLHCVRRCLQRIQLWIGEEFVPHYFIRTQTLIPRQMNAKSKRKIFECLENTIRNLNVIFRNIPPFIILLNSRSTNELIDAYFESLGSIKIDSKINEMEEDYMRMIAGCFSNVSVLSVIGSYANRHCMTHPDWRISFRHGINRVLQNDSTITSCLYSLSILSVKVMSLDLTVSKVHDSNINKEKYRQKYLLSCIIKLSRGELTPFVILSNLIQELIQHVMPLDCSNFLYCLENIERCMKERQNFKFNSTDMQNISNIIYRSLSSHFKKPLRRESIRRKRRPIFLNDIHLTEIELSLLPSTLLLEMHCRLDTDLERQTAIKLPHDFVLSIDSEALFYYLSFWFYHKLDQNINKYRYLRKLEMLCNDINSSYLHLTWNIYGHCLADMGLYKNSLRAYLNSIEVQERNVDLRSLSKATPWHVAILINKALRTR